jgi:thiol-disulfide isomerase/thioredoxin
MRFGSVFLLGAVALVAAACAAADAGIGERRDFQGFALETFEGDSLSLEELRGKVVLVTFWASWCPTCRHELPLLDSLNAAIQHPDFAAIGINDERNEYAARGYALATGLRMPTLLGRGLQWERYNYIGLPYTVLLDREGRVMFEYYGYPGRRAFDEVVAGRIWAELGD